MLVTVASMVATEPASAFGEDHREAIRLHCAATTTGSAARTACVVEALQTADPAQLVDLSEHPARAARQARLACGPRKVDGMEVYDACLRRILGMSPSPQITPAPRPVSPPRAETTRPLSPGSSDLERFGLTLGYAPPQLQRDARALFADLGRSVFVVIAAEHEQSEQVSQGSAVAIAPNLLLTNCHVVKGSRLILVANEAVRAPAWIAARDDATDRCVLATNGLDATPVTELRSIGTLEVGEAVVAIGSPSGLTNTISEGIVSGIRDHDGRQIVQTTAPISPGSSGGGLFDLGGRLIAITTFVLEGQGQLNFAVPAEDYLPLLPH